MNVRLLLLSSLEKTFPDEEPRAFDGKIEGFLNETVSFQAAWRVLDDDFTRDIIRLCVESDVSVRIRHVCFVPVLYPAPADADTDFLRKTPGLYPDALTEVTNERFHVWGNRWESAWLDIEPDESVPAGVYPIRVILESPDGTELASANAEYRKIGLSLPKQTLIRTQWFHNDALCDAYQTEMFSEKYWRAAENFIRTAAKRGINCLLTPIHTPPLDTAVGGERKTCQLVDIEKNGDEYAFGFEKLRRWVKIARDAGIEWFEMAHLFTQWGAAHAPKIVAKENGVEKRIFGWDTEATGNEYVGFLKQYLPALKEELSALGISERTIFHVSDEPNARSLDSYRAAKSVVEPFLEGFAVVDALSDVEFYRQGIIRHPVPSNDHIREFLNERIPWLWTYYCCGQYKNVSNSFIAMPSARTRVIGAQMYKYDIAGFLQWGYNFYNSQFSEYPVNPFLTTDGDGFTPAGDCFIVYPGPNETPIESIRLMVMDEAMNDIRALRLLESLKGREFALKLIDEGIEPLEFDRYPASPNYLLNLRKRVNAEIEKAL